MRKDSKVLLALIVGFPVVLAGLLYLSFQVRDFSGLYQSKDGRRLRVELSGPGYFKTRDDRGTATTYNLVAFEDGTFGSYIGFYLPQEELRFGGYRIPNRSVGIVECCTATYRRSENTLYTFEEGRPSGVFRLVE